jgi:hypothetical protein
MGSIAMERMLKPWLFIDRIFLLSALKRVQNKCLAVLHDMTNSVISVRRQELLAERGVQSMEQSAEDDVGNVWLGDSSCVCSAMPDTKLSAGL